MRIGIVGSIWIDTPPKGYGGTELVISHLVNGLVDAGHEVTFFGPQTSHVKANLYPTVKQPLRKIGIPWEDILEHLYHFSESFDHAKEFDILHVHINKVQDYISLPLAFYSKTPVLFTFHGLIPTKQTNPDKYFFLNKYKDFPFTSISHSQKNHLPFHFIKTVYNAIDIKKYTFNNNPDNYYAWLGKINPVKGTKEAILAAKKAGVKLIIMGKIDRADKKMLTYYQKEVKPLIDNKQIIWHGEATLSDKVKILGAAKALLNPILWEEPFGLVMAESQATGTPVIAYNKGAAKEVIKNNKTGFLVKDIDTMVTKIKDISSLGRSDCRKFIEEKFSIPTMVNGYLSAYKTAIQDWILINEKSKTLLR